MTTEKDAIKTNLLKFLSDSYMVDIGDIPLDGSLMDEGIIDSVGLVEIAAYLEKTYSFELDEGDMTRDNFGSVERMVNYVDRRAAANPQPGRAP